jgi:putative DNA primase/helicase
MSEADLPLYIPKLLATGYYDDGTRAGERQKITVIQEMKKRGLSDERVLSMVATSRMMDDDEGSVDFVNAVLANFAKQQRARPVLKKGDWLGAARIFVEEACPTIVHHNDEWLEWEQGAYEAVANSTMRAKSRLFLNDCVVTTFSEKTGTREDPFNPNKRDVEELEAAVRDCRHIPGSINWPAWAPWCEEPRPDANSCISFPNGILSVPSGLFIEPPTPEFFTRNKCEFDYDPDAPAPALWAATLEQYWPNDRKCITSLQEWFGLLLTSETKFHKILFIQGPMRSGKGVIVRTAVKLIGKRNVASTSLNQLGDRFGMEALIGKQVALIPEAKVGARDNHSVMAETLLKLSGGDPVSAQRKHTTDWQGTLSVRIVMTGNEVPHFADNGGALGNRFIILPMTESFIGRENLDLEVKIGAELPGILLWAIEGLERLRDQQRFTESESGLAVKHQIIRLASPVRSFIEARCELAGDAFVEKDVLYARWKQDCLDNGGAHPGSKDTFSRNLLASYAGKITATRHTLTKPDKTTKYRANTFTGLRFAIAAPDEPEQGEFLS